MEITATERMMLVKNKETICGATLQILRMVNDPENSGEIKENITTILSLLNTIASYSNSKNYDLDAITALAENIFGLLRTYPSETISELIPDYWNRIIIERIELFCNAVNSMRFDFTNKKGIKITLPKINLNIGNIIHQ